LRVLGIDLSELQYLTLTEFKNSSLDNKNLKQEILLGRYNHFEQKRKNFIKLAREVLKWVYYRNVKNY
jgi:hypothetical protein